MGLLEDSVHDDSGLGQKKRKGWKWLIGFALLFPLGYMMGDRGEKWIYSFFNSPPKISKDVLTQKWERKQYGNYGLSFETPPVTIITKPVAMPSNLESYIANWEMEQDSSIIFIITTGTVKVNSSIEKASLTGGAEGCINTIKKEDGVTDLNYAQENVNKGSIQGIVQKGTFKFNGFDRGFTNAIYTFGRVCWEINILNYSSADEVGKEVTKRIVESIQINCPDSLTH